jgi:hypothetical protein
LLPTPTSAPAEEAKASDSEAANRTRRVTPRCGLIIPISFFLDQGAGTMPF